MEKSNKAVAIKEERMSKWEAIGGFVIVMLATYSVSGIIIPNLEWWEYAKAFGLSFYALTFIIRSSIERVKDGKL
jgi:hypothetical protein